MNSSLSHPKPGCQDWPPPSSPKHSRKHHGQNSAATDPEASTSDLLKNNFREMVAINFRPTPALPFASLGVYYNPRLRFRMNWRFFTDPIHVFFKFYELESRRLGAISSSMQQIYSLHARSSDPTDDQYDDLNVMELPIEQISKPKLPAMSAYTVTSLNKNILPLIKTPSILEKVFIHSSVHTSNVFTSTEKKPNAQALFSLKKANERLEFIGDTYLNFMITVTIISRLPQATEGQLSELRSSLIKNRNLAKWTVKCGLDVEFLNYVQGIYHGKVMIKDTEMWKVYGDLFEAYIGGLLEDLPYENFINVFKWLDWLSYANIVDFAEQKGLEFVEIRNDHSIDKVFPKMGEVIKLLEKFEVTDDTESSKVSTSDVEGAGNDSDLSDSSRIQNECNCTAQYKRDSTNKDLKRGKLLQRILIKLNIRISIEELPSNSCCSLCGRAAVATLPLIGSDIQEVQVRTIGYGNSKTESFTFARSHLLKVPEIQARMKMLGIDVDKPETLNVSQPEPTPKCCAQQSLSLTASEIKKLKSDWTALLTSSHLGVKLTQKGTTTCCGKMLLEVEVMGMGYLLTAYGTGRADAYLNCIKATLADSNLVAELSIMNSNKLKPHEPQAEQSYLPPSPPQTRAISPSTPSTLNECCTQEIEHYTNSEAKLFTEPWNKIISNSRIGIKVEETEKKLCCGKTLVTMSISGSKYSFQVYSNDRKQGKFGCIKKALNDKKFIKVLKNWYAIK
ncbi:hypothetical protein WICPIJ_009275 [Wickerhamomyces pijperi]|uniref:RNase III domain-containing protein n=1 Tax=Wickerhamomyces pijperi TaxID=599730 RepID=A0A9P8PQL1_WICPI|nr:hypothetical protein WICPIJ_009275 [Wickerhamomyces pijperi]